MNVSCRRKKGKKEKKKEGRNKKIEERNREREGEREREAVLKFIKLFTSFVARLISAIRVIL